MTSTLIHCSASSDGQIWCGSVRVVFSGLSKTFVRSLFTCNALSTQVRYAKSNKNSPQDKDHTGESGEAWNLLEPIIIQIVKTHLRLSSLQNQVTKFLDLETGLERKLKLGALDDNVGEVEQVDLEWIQHTLTGDDDLFRLFLHRQRSKKNFFSFKDTKNWKIT